MDKMRKAADGLCAKGTWDRGQENPDLLQAP